MLDVTATLTVEVGYVVDKQLGATLRVKVGELGQSLGENLDR